MGRQFWKASNLLAPVPAAIITSADGEGHTDLMTAAWVGTVCSDPVMVSVSIRPSRLTHDYIEKTGEFVINLTTRSMVRAVDYVGVRSGRNIDKWADSFGFKGHPIDPNEGKPFTKKADDSVSGDTITETPSPRAVNGKHKAGLTPFPSQYVQAPGVAESPVCLECRVVRKLELGSHDMYVAEVLSTDIDDSLLDPEGRLDLSKADLIAYSHGEYFTLGEKLGKFGFSVRKSKAGNYSDQVGAKTSKNSSLYPGEGNKRHGGPGSKQIGKRRRVTKRTAANPAVKKGDQTAETGRSRKK